jgi:DNA-binding GntR family transcriptional regulator
MHSPTHTIVQSLTRAIVEHRLQPGAKLVEQKLADHFGVSRTLVRQALYQMAQNHLIVIEPARGAFVARPSMQEANQIFAVRRMLELQMTRAMAGAATPAHIKALRAHIQLERKALHNADAKARIHELGDFHVEMARLLGNEVLAQMLETLVSRCALVMLMYQSDQAAEHSADEHQALVDAIEAGDEELAVQRMQEHLENVQRSLSLQRKAPSHDVAEALA